MIAEPEFDIQKDSEKLKELVSIYESESFIKHIADIITLIQPPRIPFKPFVGLDSPLIQLLYLASLNVASSPEKIQRKTIDYNDWLEIIKYAIRVKAGYYDALLPSESEDDVEFYEKYKIVMPVFMDYFNTGTLNFEEQEIEKIESIFTSFNIAIEKHYGLKTNELIEIYNLIDECLMKNLDKPFQLIDSDSDTKSFWNTKKEEKLHPDEWTYKGTNENIIKLIEYFQSPLNRFSIKKSELLKLYDRDKINSFLNYFSIQRVERSDYLFYTSPNLFIHKPIYNIDSENYVITDTKQLINTIYKELTEFGKSLEEPYYKRRGKFLQDKIVDVMRYFFGEGAFIYNEYKTSKNDSGQDVLLLYKGLALILEAKAGKEPEPRRNANVKESFKHIALYFKKNIQSGYEQANRVKELFDNGEDFEIVDSTGNSVHKVSTRKYHSVFSIIITLDKYREAQINLNHLLELKEGDKTYPLSMCIDDFEVLFYALKRKKTSIQKLIKYLNNRQLLQGRVDTNDELQIWADFMLNDNFKVPDNPKIHYSPSILGADIFDELYEEGLGLRKEKFMREKKNKQIFSQSSRREFIKKYYAQGMI
jgi:hypothetical protein